MVLIDLRKAALLQPASLFPFIFQVAYPLVYSRDAELRDFTLAEMADLVGRGLEIIDLPPDAVGRAPRGRSTPDYRSTTAQVGGLKPGEPARRR